MQMEPGRVLNYEELDRRHTPLGELMLRRRRLLQLDGLEVYEVKLGEHFLMSSLFHEAETRLATIGLGLLEGERLDVVVGGLGLGYTAVSALEDRRVVSLTVVEFLEGVIAWHRGGLVPQGKRLTEDPRCRLVHADFFALSRDVGTSFDPERPESRHDAVLLDIDHTPTDVLHQSNRRFYTEAGLAELAQHLRPGGVFALWSNSEPEEDFTRRLEEVFADARCHVVGFDNPLTGEPSENCVYTARRKN